MSKLGSKTPSKKELAEAGRRKLEAFRKQKGGEKNGKNGKNCEPSFVSIDASPSHDHLPSATGGVEASPSKETDISKVAVQLFPPSPTAALSQAPKIEVSQPNVQDTSPILTSILPPRQPPVVLPTSSSSGGVAQDDSGIAPTESRHRVDERPSIPHVSTVANGIDGAKLPTDEQKPASSSFAAFLDRYKSKPPPLPPKVHIPSKLGAPSQLSSRTEEQPASTLAISLTDEQPSPGAVSSPNNLVSVGDAQQPETVAESNHPSTKLNEQHRVSQSASASADSLTSLLNKKEPAVTAAEPNSSGSAAEHSKPPVSSYDPAVSQITTKPASSLSSAYSSLSDLYVASKHTHQVADSSVGLASTSQIGSGVHVSAGSSRLSKSSSDTGAAHPSLSTTGANTQAEEAQIEASNRSSVTFPGIKESPQPVGGASAYASLSDSYASATITKPPMPPAPPLLSKPANDKLASLNSWLSPPLPHQPYSDHPQSNGSIGSTDAQQPVFPGPGDRPPFPPAADPLGKSSGASIDARWGPPLPTDQKADTHDVLLNGFTAPLSNNVPFLNGQKITRSNSAAQLLDREAGSAAPSGRSSPFPFADGPSSRSSEFKTLQNYINELEKEKFELLRKIEKQSELVSTLSNENEGLTEDYNKQGQQIRELQQAMDTLRSEISAQMLVMDSLQKEKEGAKSAAKEAGSRAKALANEIVALEERQRHTRSSELKLQKELEDVRTAEEDAVRKLQTTIAERSSLQAVVNVLQAEKRKLTAQLKAASAGTLTADMLEPRKTQTTEATTQTEAGYTSYTVCEGDTLGSLARQHGIDEAELARANGMTDGDNLVNGQQILVPSDETIIRAGSMDDATSSEHARDTGPGGVHMDGRGVSFPQPSTSGRIAQVAITRTRGAALLHPERHLDRLPTQVLRLLPQALIAGGSDPVLVRQGQAVLGSIDKLLQTIEEDKKNMIKMLEAKQDELFQLAAENDELRGKLETQTQRLELAVQQAMFANARLFSPVAAKHGGDMDHVGQPPSALQTPTPGASPSQEWKGGAGDERSGPGSLTPLGDNGMRPQHVIDASVSPQNMVSPDATHQVPAQRAQQTTPVRTPGERRGIARWIFGKGGQPSPPL